MPGKPYVKRAAPKLPNSPPQSDAGYVIDKTDAIAALGLVSAVTLAAFVSMLRRKALLSGQDERELYEHALMLLEVQQGHAPEMAGVYAAARAVIEEQLTR